MPTPVTAMPLKISITDGVKGQSIIVKNVTTGESINTTIADTAKMVVDLRNLPSGASVGDVIEVMVSGQRIGYSSTTLTSTSTANTMTITTSAITSGVSRGM